MFTGFSEETVQFLLDLRFHNYTEYFHQEHDRYVQTVQTPFYELIDDLAPIARKIDPLMEIRPYKCLSRIHRDTRYTKDKSPYRDHHWFLFRKAAEPREKSVFFYGEFGPERLDWGMGIWGENRELMDQFRRRMAANPDGMLAFLDDLNLEERKLIPGGAHFRRMEIPSVIPARLQPWYTFKDFYVSKFHPDYQWAFSERLADEIRTDFIRMAPLYQLLRNLQDQIAQ